MIEWTLLDFHLRWQNNAAKDEDWGHECSNENNQPMQTEFKIPAVVILNHHSAYSSARVVVMMRHKKIHYAMTGSGCDAVGRSVASITWDPRFKSSHWRIVHAANGFKTIFIFTLLDKIIPSHLNWTETCVQLFKRSTIIIYNSRVVNNPILLSGTTLEP